MAAASIYYTILTSAQQAVSGLSLVLGSTPLPVLIRKLPKLGETLDSAPVVLICPTEQPEKIIDYATEGLVYVEYGVEIVIVAANNQDYLSNLDSYLNFRQQIRLLFQGTTLTGAPTVCDMDMIPEAPIDRALVAADYDYSAISVRFKSCESRGL